jgi:hypothetical protein
VEDDSEEACIEEDIQARAVGVKLFILLNGGNGSLGKIRVFYFCPG